MEEELRQWVRGPDARWQADASQPVPRTREAVPPCSEEEQLRQASLDAVDRSPDGALAATQPPPLG
eukprot:9158218-Alexandrium_andersonii.AAC.1